MANHALCIGINDYPGTGSDLHGCVNDANDWADTLWSSGFGVDMLLDAQATRDAILSGMRNLASTAKSGDTVIVTFSGHGSFVPDLDGDEEDGYDECWCPHDVVEHQITDDELHKVISSRKDGVRWIVLSDSCHSGTVARFSPTLTPPTTRNQGAPQRLVRFLPPALFLKAEDAVRAKGAGTQEWVSVSPPGRNAGLLISGCQDHEYSYDAWFNGRPNGAFTFVARQALENLGSDATYEDWFKAIRRILPSQQYPQSPNLFGTKKSKQWPIFTNRNSHGSDSSDADKSPGRPGPLNASTGQAIARRLMDIRAKSRQAHSAIPRSTRGDRPLLLAMGDSWFDYPPADIRDWLEDKFGYEIESVADDGALVEEMAYGNRQLYKLLRRMERCVNRGEKPCAVLLSGGGNDIAGDPFAELLDHVESRGRGLNELVLRGKMQRIEDSYRTIIDAVTTLSNRILGKGIPIITHGYDYAIPDGRGFAGGWWFLPGPWLKPGFSKKGFEDDVEMREIVRQMIDRFNELQEKLKNEYPDTITYVNLRGTLPTGDNYRDWWANELHPTQRGFEAVALKFADGIRSAGC